MGRMRPPEGEKMQIEIYRRMSGEKRLQIAFSMTRLVNKLAEAGRMARESESHKITISKSA